MLQILATGLLLLTIWQLLLGLNLAEQAADQLHQNVSQDYQLASCGGLAALAANLHDAVTTWQDMGCALRGETRVGEDIQSLLQTWQDRFPEVIAHDCPPTGDLLVTLHRQINPLLAETYPNWVSAFQWAGGNDGMHE